MTAVAIKLTKPPTPSYGTVDWEIRHRRISQAYEALIAAARHSVHALWLATEHPERMLPEDRDRLRQLLAAIEDME